MSQVRLSGWKPGLEKVRLNHLLREQAGLSLSAAHAVVNRLLNGESVAIDLSDSVAAQTFAESANALGVESHVEFDRIKAATR
jgi:hypothetical protein